MKGKFVYVFWAIVFFLVGISLLVGIIDLKQLSTENWVLIETGAALAFAITYFLDGTKKWGWLLPACICAGMAIDLSKELVSIFHTGPNGVPIIIGIALWFFVGFLINRKYWWLLIPAYGLIIAAVETAVNTMIEPSILYGENSSTLVLAYSSGAGIMLMLALPLFVVYFVSKKSWWALIPAGALTSIALVTALQFISHGTQDSLFGVFTGVLLLGFSLTFAILWLRRGTQPTQWAVYPFAVFFILAILSFINGNAWNAVSDLTKIIGFAVAGTVCFIAYLLHGLRKWGWLFPALGCAAIAITIHMSSNGMDDSPLMGLPILISLAAPFYVGFFLNRKQWGLVIPAVILTMVTAILLIADSSMQDIGVFIIFSLPCFILYFVSKKSWWALIPAGIFATLGLVTVIETLFPHVEYPAPRGTLSWDVYIWVVFLGFAATFGVLWLRRKAQPTEWTGYPAVGFLVLAIASFILGEHFQEYWLSTIMLVIAGMLVLALFTRKVPAVGQQTPEIKA
jgi:hypothetical protein